jgi:hypothetical protein
MLRARKFLDAAVLKGDTIDSVLEQACGHSLSSWC